MRNNWRTIPLSRGLEAIVDNADYEWLSEYKWCAWWNKSTRTFYAVRKGKRSDGSIGMIWMHREILGLKIGDSRRGDHREPSQTLDNRRNNLRISTASQNNSNSRKRCDNKSGFKGVCFDKQTGMWRAYLRESGKQRNLGRFSTPQLAHEAYKSAATVRSGEFARCEYHRAPPAQTGQLGRIKDTPMDMISIDPSRSSQIAQIGHDGNGLCRVLFRRGGLYEYPGLSAELFDQFKNSLEPGKFFHAHIRGRFGDRKVEGSDFKASKTVVTEIPAAQTIEATEPPKSEPEPLPAEAETVGRKSTELTVQASTIEVTSLETQQQASGALLTIAAMRKEIADTFKPMKDAAHKAHKTICDQEKQLDTPLATAERTLKDRIGGYVLEQQRIAREAEEALRRAERERAELEAQQASVDQAIDDAIVLESQGDVAGAEAVLANPAPAPVRYVAPAPVAPNVARVAGVATRMGWAFRIVDEDRIPREYMLVNETAIRNAGNNTNGKIKIPGVEFYEKPIVAASRGARTA